MSIKRTFRKVANISIPCIIVCDCASPKSDFQRQYYSDACAHQPASICSRATLQSPQVGDEMRLRNSGRSSAHLHVPILLSTLLFAPSSSLRCLLAHSLCDPVRTGAKHGCVCHVSGRRAFPPSSARDQKPPRATHAPKRHENSPSSHNVYFYSKINHQGDVNHF